MFAGSTQGSHRLLTLLVALAAIALAVASVVLPSDRAEALVAGSLTPTISSDQADYPPGATVTLTGSNWQPGESVHINVNDESGRTWSRDVDVTADESGAIRDEFNLPEWFVAQYSVKATGAQSGETTTSFTDASLSKIQGKSDPPCSGNTSQCESGWQGSKLTGWDELDEFPLRLKDLTQGGPYQIVVPFDHFQTSSGSPGVQDLYGWTPSSGVNLVGTPQLTKSGSENNKWEYTVTVNVDQSATNPTLEFKGRLAAGAHSFTGASLQVGGPDVGGQQQIQQPGAVPGTPDLFVDKRGPATAAPNSTITYNLDYQNKSSSVTAIGAQLTDELPSGVTYVGGSCSGTCSVVGNFVTWDLGNLAPNSSGTKTLQVSVGNVANGNSYTDTARIRSAQNDVNPADNDDTLTTTISFNRNPVANNDSLTTNEDTPNSTNVFSNDSDPDGDNLSVTNQTNGANGTVNCTTAGVCTYTPNANFNGTDSFTYTVSDGHGGTATGTVNITVNPVNDAPVNSVPGAQNINEDQSRTFSTANSNKISVSDIDAGGDDVQVSLSADHGKVSLSGISGLTFTAGDGTDDASMTFKGTLSAINTALGGLTFAPDLNYDGTDAKLTIETNDLGHNGSGGEKIDTDSVAFNITPQNDPPVISENGVTNDGPVDEGSPATITVTATDPDTPAADLRYSFDCNGDGDYADPNDKGPQAANSAQCTYFDNGSYQVNVEVEDDRGGSDTGSTTVLVRNVDPAADFAAAPDSIDEGQSVNLSLTNVVDPGTDDTHTYRFKCSDADWSAFGASNTASCQSTDDGNLVVKGQVRDDDGGLSPEYSETITVNNVPPDVDPPQGGPNGENQSSNEGQNKPFDVGSFTDPGADGPWSVTVDWGDGSSADSFNASSPGALAQTAHTYDDNGTYTVTVTVAENGQNAPSGQASFQITVNNVDPTADLGNSGQIDEGGTATVSFTNQFDPSNADSTQGFHYAYNCDGSQFGPIPNYADLGSNDSRQCTYPDDGNYTVRGLIMDKDGGYNVYETQITVNNVGPTAIDRTGPAGQDGAYTTPEETDVQITLEADNPGGDTLTFTVKSGPDNGTLSGTTGTNLTYTPDKDFTGTDSFTFEVCDDDTPQMCDTGTVQIIVTPVNDAPVIDLNPADNTTTDDEVQFTEGDPNGVFADEGQNLTISDIDSTHLKSATVRIANPKSGDSLLTSASDPDIQITSYDSATGELKLEGTATLDAYRDLLRTVRFDNNSDDPNTTDRQVEFFVTDEEGNESLVSNTAISVVRVAGVNDDPVISENGVTNDGPVDEGSPATITVTATDPDTPAADLRYSFDCNGDGDYADPNDKGPQAANSAQCTYFDNGSYQVNVEVEDDRGGSDTGSTNVVVDNVDPSATFGATPDTIDEGDSVNLSLTNVVDPGTDDTHTYRFKCSDDPWSDFGASNTASCQATDDGNLVVKGQVRDDDGGLSEIYEQTITVNNVPPHVDPPDQGPNGENQSSDEGENKSFDVGSFTDPGADGPWGVTVDWGDGSAVENFTAANPGTLPQKPHTYADNGTYSVTVTVAEAGGAPSGQASFQITVNNLAPGITLNGPGTANEGDVKTYNFSVTDAGIEDTHTIEWHCGADGVEVTGSFSYDQNTRSGSFECRFPDGPAETNVTANATDKDGASDSDNRHVTVTVANVAPTVDLTGPSKANENDTKLYEFMITDPGNDTHTIGWDCGVGEKVSGSFQYDPSTKTGSFECHFPNGPVNATVSVSASDGNDTGSDSIIVHVANVAPTANDDQMTTTELKAVRSNILDNDTDPGNDLDRASLEILSINSLSPSLAGPHGGVVKISDLLDGNVTYMPNRGFVDIDTFRYKVCDDDGDCSSANVQVTVGPVNCNAKGVIRGTQGADILRGTPGNDVICAFGGNDRIYAGAGNDLLVGAGGWDRMWGEGGNDVMRGGDQTDAMDAGLGDDYISGDQGRDVILARAGNDSIELRDGSAGDAANGGAGTDRCKKDTGDKTVSCELP